MSTDIERTDARISLDERYRYVLTRDWGPEGSNRRVYWIMLNPSTADAALDDPTIRRCRAFAKAWGFDGLAVLNLYAYRATNPALLSAVDDPIGPDNDLYLERMAFLASTGNTPVVAAWGAKAGAARVTQVINLLRDFRIEPQCLGTTNGGHPRHPLYVAGATLPQPFAPQVTG